jgi:hypothetical protein
MAIKLRESVPSGVTPQSMFDFVFERFMQGSKRQYDLETIKYKHPVPSRRKSDRLNQAHSRYTDEDGAFQR